MDIFNKEQVEQLREEQQQHQRQRKQKKRGRGNPNNNESFDENWDDGSGKN